MNRALVVLLLSLLFSCDPNRHHVVKEYHDNGNLKYEVEFKGNKPHGYGKLYYPDGKLKSAFNFKDGEFHGKSITYYKNGKVETDRNYKDGNLEGKEVNFYDDGIKRDIDFYSKGKKIWGASFHETGDTLSINIGNVVKAFSKNGELILIDCIKWNSDSSIITKTIRFDENSEIVKYIGPLTCLTKRYSLLLDARNPEWRKLKSNFDTGKIPNYH